MIRLIARHKHGLTGISLLAGLVVPALASANTAFNTSQLKFSVQVKDIENNYSVLALIVEQNEQIMLQSAQPLTVKAGSGQLQRAGNHWQWTAPSRPGLYPVKVFSGGQMMTLNMFTVRPATDIQQGYLDQYRIGSYAPKPFRNLLSYQAPRGFISVTEENQHTQVSPHFTLAQFLCKQNSSWPKYIILQPQLLLKLEGMLEKLNQTGFQVESFEVMSGFRTPWYNNSIGNNTSSSQHLYGGAADIFVDANPRDGKMDDLNGDGKFTKLDADYFYDLFEQWSDEPWWHKHRGGLGAYGSNPAHGPFVHVDARGYSARWGR